MFPSTVFGAAAPCSTVFGLLTSSGCKSNSPGVATDGRGATSASLALTTVNGFGGNGSGSDGGRGSVRIFFFFLLNNASGMDTILIFDFASSMLFLIGFPPTLVGVRSSAAVGMTISAAAAATAAAAAAVVTTAAAAASTSVVTSLSTPVVAAASAAAATATSSSVVTFSASVSWTGRSSSASSDAGITSGVGRDSGIANSMSSCTPSLSVGSSVAGERSVGWTKPLVGSSTPPVSSGSNPGGVFTSGGLNSSMRGVSLPG